MYSTTNIHTHTYIYFNEYREIFHSSFITELINYIRIIEGKSNERYGDTELDIVYYRSK